jgi:hypothetical protein
LHYVEPVVGGGRISVAIVGAPTTVAVFARGPWGDTKQVMMTCDEPRPGRRGGP